MRSRRERALLLLQPCRALRACERRADEKKYGEREPEREAALPSTTHEGGHYQRAGLVSSLTNGNVSGLFRP